METIWENTTRAQFTQLLDKIPPFLRAMAEERVAHCAKSFAQTAGRDTITEKDLVDALFKETPFGFHGPMKTDMAAIGIDYTHYGYEK